ncbi:IS3 family transposase [Lysinibacillus sp. IITD104]|uniref:IS3 family transposase n=1 Tax=unclassified Lysinibacillus TaxID=2636778 RepID=UPI0038F75F1A
MFVSLLHADSDEAIIQAVEEYIYFYNYQRFQKRLKPSGTDTISTPDGCLVFFNAVYLAEISPLMSFNY